MEIINYEAVRFKYCEFVLILTLIIRQTYLIFSATYYIVTVACRALPYFSTLFHRRREICKIFIGRKIYVLIFSRTLETFHLLKIQ
jgi:hypothetical protein